ncbi:hypothetical protein SLVCU150_0544 [Staphylococcus lugdunensis VCU150]|nr:hypothetical protein SLVCU150_0544 [Staphylococcus lugdunensis VCU150]
MFHNPECSVRYFDNGYIKELHGVIHTVKDRELFMLMK